MLTSRIVCALAFAVSFFACDRLNPGLSDGGGDNGNRGVIEGFNRGLNAVFALYDTTGRPANVFHSQESIDMSCVVTNGSILDIAYHYGYPTISFSIIRNDSVIASSTDGYAFPQVILGGTLKAGSAISGTWRGPNTAAREEKISLTPGSYKARVAFHMSFVNASLAQPADVAFSVVY